MYQVTIHCYDHSPYWNWYGHDVTCQMCSLQHLLYPLHFKRHNEKFTSHTNFETHDFFPQPTSRETLITTVIDKFAASHNDTTVEINISLSIPTWPAPFTNTYWHFTRQQFPKLTNLFSPLNNKRENIMTKINYTSIQSLQEPSSWIMVTRESPDCAFGGSDN